MTITQTIRHGAAAVVVLTVAALPILGGAPNSAAMIPAPNGGDVSTARCSGTAPAAPRTVRCSWDLESMVAEEHRRLAATWYATHH